MPKIDVQVKNHGAKSAQFVKQFLFNQNYFNIIVLILIRIEKNVNVTEFLNKYISFREQLIYINYEGGSSVPVCPIKID